MSKSKTLITAVMIAALTATNVAAQSKKSDEPCIECAVVVVVGLGVAAALLDAMFGGKSASPSSEKDCSAKLIPSPEGGMMPADPDCR